MRRITTLLLTVLLAMVFIDTQAQVQIDKPLEMTGSGTSLRQVKNLGAPVDSTDATSAVTIQRGGLVFGTSTGSGNSYFLTLSPPVAAYQTGMVINFLSNQANTGASTLNVNGLGDIAIVKNVNQPLTGCEIQSGQGVSVLYDGTNFQMLSVPASNFTAVSNAGPDQISVSGTSTNLSGNTPTTGSGLWSVTSGSGGSITTPSSPTSLFTGVPGNSYILKWTVTNSCSVADSSVNISFAPPPHGSQTFSSPAVATAFVVPTGVFNLTIECYGAQGSTPNVSAPGGLGGYAKGSLAVQPNLTLYVSVGGSTGTNGGGIGGNSNNGGGMSDVRRGGTTFDSVLIVAGGGGGSGNGSTYAGGNGGGSATTCSNGAPGQGGHNCTSCGGAQPGGDGTCTSGGSAVSSGGGFGQTGGGGGGGLTAGGTGSDGGGYGSGGGNGSKGQGGNYGSNPSCSFGGGTGGGGGYYGGGGTGTGYCGTGGGGGGSSWSSTELTSLLFTGGLQSGNGQVVITW